MQKVLQFLKVAGKKEINRAVQGSAVSVIMAALLSSPTNARVFEELKGLLIVTELLKSMSSQDSDNTEDSSLRKALVELLCVYLLPEKPTAEHSIRTRTVSSPSYVPSSTVGSTIPSATATTTSSLLPSSSSSTPPCESSTPGPCQNGSGRSDNNSQETAAATVLPGGEKRRDRSVNTGTAKTSQVRQDILPGPRSRKRHASSSNIDITLSFLCMAARYRGKIQPTEKKQAMLAQYIPNFSGLMAELQSTSDLVSCSRRMI